MGMNPRLLRPTGGFNPKSIAGLALWLDATKTSSMLFNNNNNPPTVSQWDDLSGNGYHATQDTDNNRPTYQATGMNGRPGLQFTTSPSNLLLSSATIADVFGTPTTSIQATIFSVMRCVAGGNSATFGSDVSANGRFVLSLRLAVIANSDTLVDIVASGATTGRQTVQVSQQDAEAAALFRILRAGGPQSLHRNGSQLASSTMTNAFSVTTAKISIGKAIGVGSAGVFSELLFYNRDLSATEVSAVERYLASKYGLTLA
jgi:hypothetical protein